MIQNFQKSKVVVVIPIYNEVLKPHEKISLRQCLQVLNNYPVAFVCSKEFSRKNYITLAEEEGKEVRFETFDSFYFQGVAGYNKLMLSKIFYERFEKYEFILIHQTDVYIFKDDLEKWCSLGYDYIGAPWLMDIKQWLNVPNAYPFLIKWYYKLFGAEKMQRTGNGGFSLRKVESFIYSLDHYKFWVKIWKSNEDNFFSQCLSVLNSSFVVADYKIALQFSFDAMPQEAYKLNNNELPFGCHAFNRNDGAYNGNALFWREFIPSLKVI